MLDRYNEIMQQIAALTEEANEIKAAVKAQVEITGEMAGYGWKAYFKPGRNSTDHEAAVKAWQAEINDHEMHGLALKLDEVIEKHTTVKTSVAWTKVTKDAKIDTSNFVTQSEPVFVIETM